MAIISLISDYATLQAAVAEYLKRTDLTDKVKVFIQMAEARIFSEPDLNLKTLEKRATFNTVVNQKYYGSADGLPTDIKSFRHIKLTLPSTGDGGGTRRKKLLYMPPERIDTEFPDELDLARLQEPIAWTTTGDEIALLPAPNEATELEIFYHAQWTALSDASPTNWLVINQPDLYLYGSLIESAPYLIGDARLATWVQLYDEALVRIVDNDRKIRIPDGGNEQYTEISEVMLDYSRRGYLY